MDAIKRTLIAATGFALAALLWALLVPVWIVACVLAAIAVLICGGTIQVGRRKWHVHPRGD